ncbi:MAG: hypothetical protein NWE91_08700 [Candidatus Bathyarchaeota archaeon]|nr:hypothetical protein [Candidatus Bathyarchaeota archaeon]
MRLLFANFDGMLGLYGNVDFVSKQPVIFYGENLSGKTNIINAFRYCIDPPLGRRKTRYSEDKKLGKDEILISPLNRGSAAFYFSQGNTLLKLRYDFRRKGKHISSKQFLYIKEEKLPESGIEKFLEQIDWGRPVTTSVKEIRSELEKRRIYPEILDILIAPSNVANFSRAMNKEVVSIPELIQKRIENIRSTAEKYGRHLSNLHDLGIRERELLNRRKQSLKEEIVNLEVEEEKEIEEYFRRGSEGINNFKEKIEAEMKKIPEKTEKVALNIERLATQINTKTKAVSHLSELVEAEEEFRKALQEKEKLEEAKEKLNEWNMKLSTLPDAEQVEILKDFDLPEYKDFNFSVLKHADEVEKILEGLSSVRTTIAGVCRVADKYHTSPSDLSNTRKEYSGLLKTIEKPIKKPDGIQAILFFAKEEAKVGIALDELVKELKYIRISPIPRAFKPKKVSKELMKLHEKHVATLKDAIKELKDSLKDLKNARRKYSEIKTEQLAYLQREIESLKRKIDYRKDKITDLNSKWMGAYSLLCEPFQITKKAIDLTDIEQFEDSVETVKDALTTARKKLKQDLTEQLKDYEKIVIPEKIDKDSIKRILDLLEEKADKLKERGEKLQKARGWVDENFGEIQGIEEKLQTIGMSEIACLLGVQIFDIVRRKSNLKEIVERLAQNIEANVKLTYQRILSDENLMFEHIGEGLFRCTLKEDPITHPSGAQRAVISLGIMMSIAKAFGLPILLDEAADRFDYLRLPQFLDYIIDLVQDPRNPQVCLAMYKTLNVERNPEMEERMTKTGLYILKKVTETKKNIKPLNVSSLFSS